MIRVMYRWKLRPEHTDTFVVAWWEATHYIQTMAPGARGSMLLRSGTEMGVYVAVARWESLESWQAHRHAPSVVPEEITRTLLAAVTGPSTIEIFDEVREWHFPHGERSEQGEPGCASWAHQPLTWAA